MRTSTSWASMRIGCGSSHGSVSMRWRRPSTRRVSFPAGAVLRASGLCGRHWFVGDGEGVQEGLQVGGGGGLRRLGAETVLEALLESFGFSLVWGLLGLPFFLMQGRWSSVSRALRTPFLAAYTVRRPVNDWLSEGMGDRPEKAVSPNCQLLRSAADLLAGTERLLLTAHNVR